VKLEILFLLLTLLVLLAPVQIRAATSTNPVAAMAAWDASPDTNVLGYRLYWGRVSHVYTNSRTLGKVLTATVSNLLASTKYYFAATSWTTNGASTNLIESVFSGEGVFPPAITNYVSLLVEKSGALNGVWSNYWTATFTNPPASNAFFRFGISTTNSGSVIRLSTGQLQLSNTNTP